MPNQKDNEKEGLYSLLRSHGFDPAMRDTTGGVVPVSNDAEVFQFNFDAEGESSPVTVSIDEDNKLVIYYGDDVKQTGSEQSWYDLLKELKHYAQQHQLSFQLKNKDHLRYDMAKRTHMKQVDEAVNPGLAHWVKDYKAARVAGNVQVARQIKANIDKKIAQDKLDKTEVFGKENSIEEGAGEYNKAYN